MTASLPNSPNCPSSFSDSSTPITRNRPWSNFRAMTRAKSERTEWMSRGNTPILYWLKQGAGKSTLPRHPCDTTSSAMFDFVVYLLYRTGSAIASALPLRFLFAVGRFLGFWAWLVSGKYRRLAERNVAIAFANEKSPREMHRLVRRHFQRLGANLLCGLKLASMPLEKVRERVAVENAEAPERELRNGRPVIFVLSHIGNWELQAQMFPPIIGFARNSTIYQPLKNRYIDRHVRALRARAGVELFDRNEGFQKAIQLLREGGAIGILSDQHAGD